jgi:hypothetical protein
MENTENQKNGKGEIILSLLVSFAIRLLLFIQ